MNLENWRKDAHNLNAVVETTIKDKEILQRSMGFYLKQIFDYDEIDFSENFEKIRLYFDKDTPVKVADTDIDLSWEITTSFTDKFGFGVAIDVYPFRAGDG